jgi:hypothetical protein
MSFDTPSGDSLRRTIWYTLLVQPDLLNSQSPVDHNRYESLPYYGSQLYPKCERLPYNGSQLNPKCTYALPSNGP